MFVPINNRDVEVLKEICNKAGRGTDILEIGHGVSTNILVKYGKVDVVDINDSRIGAVDGVNFIKIDSMNFMPSKAYDLVFIDGEHTYNYVKNDISKALSCLRFGGILCGHDYECETYDEGNIHLDYVADKHHGVIKAVNEAVGIPNRFKDSTIWWVKKG